MPYQFSKYRAGVLQHNVIDFMKFLGIFEHCVSVSKYLKIYYVDWTSKIYLPYQYLQE